jgi:N-methylhydantoinase B/oxoprolinase/acetone carboxylase alpha subunit
MMKSEKIDPITFQLIKSYCESVTREMGIIMIRTACSPVFVEGEDFSCSILDRWGEMISLDRRNPSLVSSMALSARWVVMEKNMENLKPGDVILRNDVYMGGTHTPDFVLIKPIFYKGQLVAVVGNCAHHLDVGGSAPGSFDAGSTELYQEGICFPGVRWYREGIEDTDITEILLQNIRVPDIQFRDFQAQLASLDVGERGIQALCDKYGAETVTSTFEAIKDYSETLLRNEIEKFPDGEYSFEDFISDDGISDTPIRVRVTVKINGSDIVFDFTGTSNQTMGPMNAPYGVTASSVLNAILQVTDPEIPVNHGCFRAFKIIAHRGTLVNPNFPAPVIGGNTHTALTIMETILGAFAQFIPERITAASYGTVIVFVPSGFDTERNRPFIEPNITVGGWGGRKDMDGWDAIFSQQGNCRLMSSEILESKNPWVHGQHALLVDATGAGKWRGGFGTIRTFTLLCDTRTSFIADRHKIGPFGLFGGLPAKPNAVLIRKKGTNEYKPLNEIYIGLVSAMKGTTTLQKGDTIAIIQACGGGYGNPFERDPELVLEDVENELISVKTAREDYGVAVFEENGDFKIDVEETTRLRSAGLQKKLNIVKDVVSVNDAYIEARERLKGIPFITRETEFSHSPPFFNWIADSKKRISVEYCKVECDKQGDPRRCPWYDDESLAFWPLHRIRIWTKKWCPLQEKCILQLV